MLLRPWVFKIGQILVKLHGRRKIRQKAIKVDLVGSLPRSEHQPNLLATPTQHDYESDAGRVHLPQTQCTLCSTQSLLQCVNLQ